MTLEKTTTFFYSLPLYPFLSEVLSLVLWFGFSDIETFFVATAGLKQRILLRFVSDSPGLQLQVCTTSPMPNRE